jgi:arabinogalactan oligomer/maltooligosaccharide transport system permease protein
MASVGGPRGVFRRIRGSAYLFILPALIGLVFLVLYPFAFNIFVSFTNMNTYHIRPCAAIFTENAGCYSIQSDLFRNYLAVFSDPAFLQIAVNTIIWTFANVIPHVTIGLVLAFVLNSKVRGKSVYRMFMIVPWAMPSFITLLIWKEMFNYQYGVINALLAHIGVGAINWLNGGCSSAMLAMIIANVWLGYPFMMIIFSGALQSIPNELYEAASIDGAVGLRQMWHISIPLIRPTIVIGFFLGCIWTFNNFNAAYLITAGGPYAVSNGSVFGCSTIFITQAYNLAFPGGGGLANYAVGAAYAFIAFLMLLVPGVFWNRSTGLTRRAT